jgi:ssDNA-binding Zn-finger/Zn-ribbon topoisomerase 1
MVDQGRQVRHVPRLQRLSGVREHPRARDADPGAEGDLDETCENCGRPMAVKRGRFGQFLACTGYPECKTTRKIIATKQGDDGGEAGPGARRGLSEVRLEPRAQARPLRRVHRLQQLPGLPVREAEDDRRRLSQGRRRHRREEVAAREGVLRMCELSPTATSRSGTGRCSSRVRSAARRSWSRRSPSATGGSCSATTRRARLGGALERTLPVASA